MPPNWPPSQQNTPTLVLFPTVRMVLVTVSWSSGNDYVNGMSVLYILIHPSSLSTMSVCFRDLKGHKDLSVSLDRRGQTYVASMGWGFFRLWSN